MNKIGKIAIPMAAAWMLVASLTAEERPLTAVEHQEIITRASLNTCSGCHRFSTRTNPDDGLASEEIADEVRQLLSR